MHRRRNKGRQDCKHIELRLDPAVCNNTHLQKNIKKIVQKSSDKLIFYNFRISPCLDCYVIMYDPTHYCFSSNGSYFEEKRQSRAWHYVLLLCYPFWVCDLTREVLNPQPEKGSGAGLCQVWPHVLWCCPLSPLPPPNLFLTNTQPIPESQLSPGSGSGVSGPTPEP